MEQRFNAALTQEPRGTVHIPGVNAGSSKSSTNDTMNIELKNDGCDRSTTACDGSEVNVTDARLSSDVAGVGLGNKAADQASTNEVRRPQRDDCGFQVRYDELKLKLIYLTSSETINANEDRSCRGFGYKCTISELCLSALVFEPMSLIKNSASSILIAKCVHV